MCIVSKKRVSWGHFLCFYFFSLNASLIQYIPSMASPFQLLVVPLPQNYSSSTSLIKKSKLPRNLNQTQHNKMQ